MALLFGGSGEKLTAQFQGTQGGDGGREDGATPMLSHYL